MSLSTAADRESSVMLATVAVVIRVEQRVEFDSALVGETLDLSGKPVAQEQEIIGACNLACFYVANRLSVRPESLPEWQA